MTRAFLISNFKFQISDCSNVWVSKDTTRNLNLNLQIPGLCSSRAEQASHKREVGGSNPPIATKRFQIGLEFSDLEIDVFLI